MTGVNWTERYPWIVEDVARLAYGAIAADDTGRSEYSVDVDKAGIDGREIDADQNDCAGLRVRDRGVTGVRRCRKDIDGRIAAREDIVVQQAVAFDGTGGDLREMARLEHEAIARAEVPDVFRATRSSCQLEGVIAGSAVESVSARAAAAAKDVVAGSSEQDVDPGTAVEHVIAVVADKQVVAGAAEQLVVAERAAQEVDAPAASNEVVAILAKERVIAG